VRARGRTVSGLAVAALALVLARSASAAAPRYILVTGPALGQPVVLGNWSENLKIMVGLQDGTRVGSPELAGRPRFLLSLFWSADLWKRPPTRPAGAEQRGWFYPAYGRRPAAIEIVASTYAPPVRQRSSFETLAVLARHGVPTRCAENLKNRHTCVAVSNGCRATRVETTRADRTVVRAGPFEGTILPDYDVVGGLFSLRVGEYRTPDRSLSQKIGWVVSSQRVTGESLTVTGRRLTQPVRTFRQEFARAYGPGIAKPFFATVITPPRAGCWRLTFRSGAVAGALTVLVRGF
jgi:hypothetical protein